MYISVLLIIKNAPFGIILRNKHCFCTRKGLFTLFYTPEVQDKIFVPFFTTKQRDSGIGLSLCLVLENYILGTVIGLVGIVLLLGFIPLVKGLK